MTTKFNLISIRGRISYLIICFETYVLSKYPDNDWSQISDFMWKLCDDSDFIDNTAYKYMEIIPEFLYEFKTYDESDFDYLSEEQYNFFSSIIPSDDSSLNTLMHNIYNVAMEYAYTAIPKYAPDTIQYITQCENILKENHLELPDIKDFSAFTDSEHWWGEVFDGRYLSKVLNNH